MRDRGDDKVTGILKADEAPIEQVIDAWSQQQSIFSIEALIVRRVAPRLAMAGNGIGRYSLLKSGSQTSRSSPVLIPSATALSGEN